MTIWTSQPFSAAAKRKSGREMVFGIYRRGDPGLVRPRLVEPSECWTAAGWGDSKNWVWRSGWLPRSNAWFEPTARMPVEYRLPCAVNSQYLSKSWLYVTAC